MESREQRGGVVGGTLGKYGSEREKSEMEGENID